tara:strand:- start:17290 stop:18369 length:1080 start_codon:yes stop_codon:yes gene_type:complete
LKKTPLYHQHKSLNAKMAPFGGYLMPIQYDSLIKEHLSVRNNLGVFDVSHMGEFKITGENAIEFLQYVCSNDISKIPIGKAQYNYFPSESGGIIDDLIVYKLDEKEYLLVVNASNIEKDWNHLEKNNKAFGAKIKNISDQTALLSVQGPRALEAMQSLTDFKLNSLPYYGLAITKFAGFQNILIATTGYTGAGGIEIFFQPNKAEKIWYSILEAGSAFRIKPVGLGARDSLRTEMGYCLYGNEIDETTSPIAAGLGWISEPEKRCINFKNISRQKSNGTEKKLIGFVIEGRAIPRNGYILVDKYQNQIGKVTSGTLSPYLEKAIGLGYVKSDFSSQLTDIGVVIRGKVWTGKIVKTPFI